MKNRNAHLGKRVSEETKQKISEKTKNKKVSDETKKKISEAKAIKRQEDKKQDATL